MIRMRIRLKGKEGVCDPNVNNSNIAYGETPDARMRTVSLHVHFPTHGLECKASTKINTTYQSEAGGKGTGNMGC